MPPHFVHGTVSAHDMQQKVLHARHLYGLDAIDSAMNIMLVFRLKSSGFLQEAHFTLNASLIVFKNDISPHTPHDVGEYAYPIVHHRRPPYPRNVGSLPVQKPPQPSRPS